MSAPTANSPDFYASLRYPEFRRLVSANFLLTCALLIQEVVLGYELYRITKDPLALGLTGLAEAVPFMGLALFGGHLADRRERRRLMLGSQLVTALGSVVLLLLMLDPARLSRTLLLVTIYGVIALVGLARGIWSPAASSLKAFLVPREHYANSATWSSTFWQAAAILGPGAAGFLYAGLGITGTLALVVALIGVSMWQVTGIAPRPPVPVKEEDVLSLWQSLREGLDYVFRTRIMFYAITLDMISVFFGGVVAILPIYAQDILAVGPEGLGILRAAPSVGAFLTVLLCTWRTPVGQAWRNLLWAVAGFGIATLVFAVSPWFWLSAAMLFFTGAFDSVSVVIRQTILQMLPPDHLRGRVQAVNSIFISSSNELGAFESGLAARLMGTVPSVLMGGSLTVLTVLWIWRRSRELFAVKLA